MGLQRFTMVSLYGDLSRKVSFYRDLLNLEAPKGELLRGPHPRSACRPPTGRTRKLTFWPRKAGHIQRGDAAQFHRRQDPAVAIYGEPLRGSISKGELLRGPFDSERSAGGPFWRRPEEWAKTADCGHRTKASSLGLPKATHPRQGQSNRLMSAWHLQCLAMARNFSAWTPRDLADSWTVNCDLGTKFGNKSPVHDLEKEACSSSA